MSSGSTGSGDTRGSSSRLSFRFARSHLPGAPEDSVAIDASPVASRPERRVSVLLSSPFPYQDLLFPELLVRVDPRDSFRKRREKPLSSANSGL